MDALQFITLPRPVLPVVAGIIVRYFGMRFDIAQGDHTEIIVVAGVGMVRMVDIPEVAGDFDGLVRVDPQHVAAIDLARDAPNVADNGPGRYCNAGKQTFAMNCASGDVKGRWNWSFEFQRLKSIILQLSSEYNKNIVFRECSTKSAALT